MSSKIDEVAVPKLSVVVLIASDSVGLRCDASHLERTLESVAQQVNPPSMEVIVPHHLFVTGIEALRSRFPGVRFLRVAGLRPGARGGHEHHHELLSRGLAAARGEIVALTEDHAIPDRNWCARIVEAHESETAAVGGAIENGIDRPLNRAVYLCDFFRYQNPVPAGESAFASDANVSYKRSSLEAIRQVWRDSFKEPAVNAALRARGYRIILSPDVVVREHRLNLTLGAALRERFIWGRSYAAARARELGARRLLYAALCPGLPLLLYARMARTAAERQRAFGRFLWTTPWILPLLVCWSSGEMAGYLTGRT